MGRGDVPFEYTEGHSVPWRCWGQYAPEGRMEFEAFWLATDEQPFHVLIGGLAECYRLSVRTSRGANHRVVRMQRSSVETAAGTELVAHFFQWGAGHAASASTHRI